jgi:hypothetical protein
MVIMVTGTSVLVKFIERFTKQVVMESTGLWSLTDLGWKTASSTGCVA